MIRRNIKKTSYLDCSLNKSPSKQTHRFPQAPRFPQNKTFSPDKYYNIPSTIEKRAAGIGYGNKVDIVLKELNDPGRIRLRTDIDEIAQGYRFGVRPPSGQQITQNKPQKRPKKQIQQMFVSFNRKSAQRNSQQLTRHSPHTKSTFKEEKQSNPKERKSSYRLKYEYSQKCLQDNNNKSSYTEFLREKSPKRVNSNFSRAERMKLESKTPPKVGPGSYYLFSEFGDS